MCPHAVESTEGRTGKNWEEAQEEDGHPGGGQQLNRRSQGGSDGGRSQGDDTRDLAHVAPRGTKATAIMANHGGADRGKSHGGGRAEDSRVPTIGGRADGSRDLGGGGDPKGCSGAGATECRGGSKGMQELDKTRGTR